MNPGDYEFVGELLKRRSGLVLAPGKDYLLESRLMPIVRERGLNSLGELIAELRRPISEALQSEVTEAMTTNESFFFRDNTPFDLFRQDMLPALLESRAPRRRLRIWCAACSTGQEPYSLAIILNEMADKLVGWRVEIVATDLSGEVLEKAKVGMYSQFEVQRGMPIQMLVKYFTQVGELWNIDAGIRAMVDYRKLNLLENFSHLGTFDIVFCRNVLIYFDQPTKAQVLSGVSSLIAPDGYLLLGAAETVLGITEAFKPVPSKKGLYAPSAALATVPTGGEAISAIPTRRAV
jgi:chemotaxis protein methyltransferase CheR